MGILRVENHKNRNEKCNEVLNRGFEQTGDSEDLKTDQWRYVLLELGQTKVKVRSRRGNLPGYGSIEKPNWNPASQPCLPDAGRSFRFKERQTSGSAGGEKK